MSEYTRSRTGLEMDTLLDVVDASLPVVNRLAGNQNLNVQGPDGLTLPDATPRDYPSPGTQFAAGWYVGTSILGMTNIGGIIDATSGSYYRLYGGDRTADFNAVKLGDDSMSLTGVTVSFDGTNTKITVDIATAGQHKFPQMSEQKGVAPDVSDGESISAYYAGFNEANFEELLPFGEYSAGAFTLPAGRTNADYAMLEVHSVSAGSGAQVNSCARASKTEIAANPTNLNIQVSFGAGSDANIVFSSTTAFSVVVAGAYRVKYFIGYLKPGVL